MSSRTGFLDIEASSLGEHSFPVEVGWAFLGGGSGSALIRPAPDWEQDLWDPEAEEVHGITLAEVIASGRPARDVADDLNRVLSGATFVLSDAPDQDSYWLRRLFEETPERQAFELKDERVERIRRFGERGRAASLGPGPRAHRAEADALALARLWRDLGA